MKKFLLFLLLATPIFALAQHARYTLNFSPNPNYDGAGDNIPYMKFLPPDYNPTGATKHPLIIYLHGQGETGYGSPEDITRLNSVALPKYLNNPNATMTFPVTGGGTKSFIVLVPQKHKDPICPPCYFERQFPAYYIDEMLEVAASIPNVDPDRIFLSGISVGAGMVWDYPALSDTNARKFAGIVPVSGNPVISYSQTAGVANLCNIAENKVASRGYIAYEEMAPGDSSDGVIKLDSARRAQKHLNDTCIAPGKIPSQLLLTRANGVYGHNAAFWNLVYDTAYGGGDPSLNMYTWMANIARAPQSSLPVKLKYFKGKSLNSQNILEWATSLERNSDRIELLRSTDGEVYTVIATFTATGSSAAEKEYSYRDNSAPKGTSYYQLRQVDKDAKSELSRVVTLNNRNQAFVIEKYPNPVTDRLNMKIEGSIFGVLEVQVLDLKGNLVKKMTIRKDQANWSGFVDVRELAKGMYMLHLTASDGKKEVSSFIKN